MNHFKFVFRICASRLLLLSLVLFLTAAFVSEVMADTGNQVNITETTTKPKDISYLFRPREAGQYVGGNVTTFFKMHPEDTDNTSIRKDLTNLAVEHPVRQLDGSWAWQPGPVIHEHNCGEHPNPSIARAEYNLGLKKTKVIDGLQEYKVKADVMVNITPGENNPAKKISVNCKVRDPWSFSDLDSDAMFFFEPNGADHQFSLLEGTSFAQGDFEADDTYMLFKSRLSSGSIHDANAFWDDSLPNAIDLYSLMITSDELYNLNVDLVFGASTSLFTLDFRDADGVAFDPTDSLAVDAIEEQIRDAFISGVVTSDFLDVFTVGFVPTAMVEEYTLGDYAENQLGALEVPEPVTMAFLMLGGCAILRRRK